MLKARLKVTDPLPQDGETTPWGPGMIQDDGNVLRGTWRASNKIEEGRGGMRKGKKKIFKNHS